MRSLFLIFTLLLTASQNFSQSKFTLEPEDSCINYILQFHAINQKSDSTATKIYKEKKWFNLLPSIGYDLITNRPTISFSISNYVGFINRKNDIKYRQYQISRQSENQIINDTIGFKSGYRELQLKINLYYQEEILINQDTVLLQIKTQENKKLQATTEDLLKVKFSLLEKQFNHQKEILAILSLASGLEKYLHRSFKIKIPAQTQFVQEH